MARLAADPGCGAGRLIALRTSDAVEEIRDRAWRAMAWRTAVDQAVEIVPVLVRLLLHDGPRHNLTLSLPQLRSGLLDTGLDARPDRLSTLRSAL